MDATRLLSAALHCTALHSQKFGGFPNPVPKTEQVHTNPGFVFDRRNLTATTLTCDQYQATTITRKHNASVTKNTTLLHLWKQALWIGQETFLSVMHTPTRRSFVSFKIEKKKSQGPQKQQVADRQKSVQVTNWVSGFSATKMCFLSKK